jgi:hypothetical protein
MIASVIFRLEVSDKEMGAIGGCIREGVSRPRNVRGDGGTYLCETHALGHLDEEPATEAGTRGDRRNIA